MKKYYSIKKLWGMLRCLGDAMKVQMLRSCNVHVQEAAMHVQMLGAAMYVKMLGGLQCMFSDVGLTNPNSFRPIPAVNLRTGNMDIVVHL